MAALVLIPKLTPDDPNPERTRSIVHDQMCVCVCFFSITDSQDRIIGNARTIKPSNLGTQNITVPYLLSPSSPEWYVRVCANEREAPIEKNKERNINP